jgi:hypothetical protein
LLATTNSTMNILHSLKMWAALPLLFIQPIESKRTADELQSNFLEVTWNFHSRFWSENKNQFELISFWTRLMMIIRNRWTGDSVVRLCA